MTRKASVIAIAIFFLGGKYCCVSSQQESPQSETATPAQSEPSVDYTPHPWREWTQASDDQTIYGQFAKVVDKSKVVVFNRLGEQISIPIHKLIDQDIFEALKSSAEVGTENEAAALVPMMDMQLETIEEETTDDSLTELVQEEFELEPIKPKTDKEKAEEKEAMIKAAKEWAAKQKAAKENVERKHLEGIRKNRDKEQAAKQVGEKRIPPKLSESKEQTAKREAIRKEREFLAQWDQTRTWTDVSGKHTFIAKFEKIVDQSQVFLKTDKGKEIAVPLSKLSADDIHVAVHGELCRPDGTKLREIAVSSSWIPGKNKN